MKLASFLLLCCMAAMSDAFFQKTATTKTPSLTQEAVDIFGNLYPYGQAPREKTALSKLSGIGVPKVDIDGTRYDKPRTGKRLTDISEKEAADSFNTLASIYGAERALDMVKIFPICLTFNKSEFKGSFEAWTEVFGEEETKEMYEKMASKASDQTMVFSYIVGATRPIGKAGPISIMLLVLTPTIESLTGISIREPFLATFGISI
ncbi:MAG: hypothetical protein SGILL_001679 [Bacillariaceae sp.]